MKIDFFYTTTAPWNECEQSIIGLSILNEGNGISFTFGFFFIEIGVKVWRKLR
jgi:hypothetical protein